MRGFFKKVYKSMENNICESKKVFRMSWQLYLPIAILLVYIALGYVCYVICPIEWPLRYDKRTMWYILLVMLFLFVGYIFGTRGYKKRNIKYIEFSITKFYNILLLTGGVLYLPTSFYKTGKIIPPVINSLISPGKQYFETLERIQNRPGYINLLGCFYIITYAVVIVTYFYWTELNKKQKVFGGILFILYLLLELSTGKNIGIVTLTTSIIVCCCAKMCADKEKKNAWKYIVITMLLLVSMMSIFVYILKSRTGYSVGNEEIYASNVQNYGKDEGQIQEITNENVVSENTENTENTENKENKDTEELLKNCPEADRDTILLTYSTYQNYEKNYEANFSNSAEYIFQDYINNSGLVSDYYRFPDALSYLHVDNEVYLRVPDNLKFLYAMGTIYLSNGYHGLSLALYLPWDCSYGLGHLKAVQYYLDKLFGIGGDVPSYENKLNEIGWPVGLRWGTVFIQFASDFSFFGSLVVMFLMGWLLAKLWMEVVAGGNPISVVLFAFYCVQFFFITSWWYAGLTRGYFITFYIPLVIWIIQRLVINRQRKNYSE